MSFYVTTAHLMCHEARLAHIVSKEYAGTLREVEPHIAVSAYGKPQCSSTLEIHTAMCMRKSSAPEGRVGPRDTTGKHTPTPWTTLIRRNVNGAESKWAVAYHGSVDKV